MDLAGSEFNETPGQQLGVAFNPASAEKLFANSGHTFAELANSFSAEAGLKATPSCCPGVSLNSEPARSMDGSLRLAEMRDQGMSIEAGLKMVITPATPAASRDFQRSPAV